jgi:hypothetical protein
MIITHFSRIIYGIYSGLIKEIQVMSIGNPVGHGNTRILTDYAQNLPQHQHVQVLCCGHLHIQLWWLDWTTILWFASGNHVLNGALFLSPPTSRRRLWNTQLFSARNQIKPVATFLITFGAHMNTLCQSEDSWVIKWAPIPISFRRWFFWCSFLDSHPTTHISNTNVHSRLKNQIMHVYFSKKKSSLQMSNWNGRPKVVKIQSEDSISIYMKVWVSLYKHVLNYIHV